MKIAKWHGTGENLFYRYKLYHIPFWLAYQYLWWVIAIGNPLVAAEKILFTVFIIKFLFYTVFQMTGIFFNLYYLIPKYLETDRFKEYGLWLAATVICTAWLTVPAYYITAYASHKTIAELFGFPMNSFFIFINNTFPPTIASMTLAMTIKLTNNWIRTNRRQNLLEKEKLETELKFLRNQFNPHFLFNTINSIFFLIHKNAGLASDALAMFSDLLRYQLYECNELQVPLSKEIAYLSNFIELEKLRKDEQVKIEFQNYCSGKNSLVIAPFILMVFVENAFKHVSLNSRGEKRIDLNIHLEDNRLYFSAKNSSSTAIKSETFSDYGGIGLKNVVRRMELVYPGKYDLTVNEGTDFFKIGLILQLAEETTPSSPVNFKRISLPINF